MVTIMKALMATLEDYVDSVETVRLERKQPGKDYTSDRIVIRGSYNIGKQYTLELSVDDVE